MKTFRTLSLSIALMMASLLSLNAGVSSNVSSTEGTPIIIYQKPDDSVGPPRTVNPFFAELSNFGVVLGSSESIGTVSVSITSTAGDDYSTYFNTSIGMILLPISGDAGDYLISITTPDGIHYIGEFSL